MPLWVQDKEASKHHSTTDATRDDDETGSKWPGESRDIFRIC